MKKKPLLRIDLSEEFQHLDAAPIVEAVIHWVARASKTFPTDDAKKKLADRLTDYPGCKDNREFQLTAQFPPNAPAAQFHREDWHGVRFTSSDERQIVQFNRDGVVFSRLEPYEDWERFEREGLNMWRLFCELTEPLEIQQLGVRFINRIMPIELEKIGRYLSRPRRYLDPLGMKMSSFFYQSQYDVPDEPFRINVVQTIQPPGPKPPTGYGLILDIDVTTSHRFSLSERPMLESLRKMRWLKNKVFFHLVSQRAIESFKRGKE
jgi:uncharacterized protein (TIGR04255 family)